MRARPQSTENGLTRYNRMILDEIGQDDCARPFMKEKDFLDEKVSLEDQLVEVIRLSLEAERPPERQQRAAPLNSFGIWGGAHSSASGNSACHSFSLQTCNLVGATRYRTGPDPLRLSSISGATETGEFTHNEPSASFTTVMRVGSGTPMARTAGPSMIDTFSANF